MNLNPIVHTFKYGRHTITLETGAICRYGAFMDTDGFGYYASDKEVSNIEASPNAFRHRIIREDFTHVCWYNK